MIDPQNKQLIFQAIDSREPEIGRGLWAINDARQRTFYVLKGMNPAAIDWSPAEGGHTIGALLFHIAAIEISWLGIEVLEGKVEQRYWDAFPYEVRDEQDRLTIVKGLSLDEHYGRFELVRRLLLDTYTSMSINEFRRPRSFPEYDVTPEFVLHHLCQHEAEHRSEIGILRSKAEKALGLD
jgi:uncharacterized damage-inducible protein DinB